MSSDLVPTGGSFLDQLNLPKLLAGPAGEAISRLVGGSVDIPAAWLNRFAQGIKDKTEAKSVVSKAVADATANLVKNDPEILERAAHSLLSKELRRQTNKESIAKLAIEDLSKEPELETATPTEDWLNVFERYAEDASSERMQDIWSRIFSGELRRQHTFSLSTLRLVAELDEAAVALFEKWSPHVINDEFIAHPPLNGYNFVELLNLEDSGLIHGVARHLNKQYDFKETDIRQFGGLLPTEFKFKDYSLIAMLRPPANFQISAVLLTKAGQELFKITKTPG